MGLFTRGVHLRLRLSLEMHSARDESSFESPMRLDPRAPSIYSNIVSVASLDCLGFRESEAWRKWSSLRSGRSISIARFLNSPRFLSEVRCNLPAFSSALSSSLSVWPQRQCSYPYDSEIQGGMPGFPFVGAAGYIASILLVWLTIFAAVTPFFQLTGAKSSPRQTCAIASGRRPIGRKLLRDNLGGQRAVRGGLRKRAFPADAAAGDEAGLLEVRRWRGEAL